MMIESKKLHSYYTTTVSTDTHPTVTKQGYNRKTVRNLIRKVPYMGSGRTIQILHVSKS